MAWEASTAIEDLLRRVKEDIRMMRQSYSMKAARYMTSREPLDETFEYGYFTLTPFRGGMVAVEVRGVLTLFTRLERPLGVALLTCMPDACSAIMDELGDRAPLIVAECMSAHDRLREKRVRGLDELPARVREALRPMRPPEALRGAAGEIKVNVVEMSMFQIEGGVARTRVVSTPWGSVAIVPGVGTTTIRADTPGGIAALRELMEREARVISAASEVLLAW